jgi:hypothetical protein
MKPGILLLVAHDVIEDLVAMGVIDANGNLFGTALDSLKENFQFAAMVEKRLKARGVVVQTNVDKVINALPLIFALVVGD